MTHATSNNILKNGIYFVKSLRSTNYELFAAINYRYVAALSMLLLKTLKVVKLKVFKLSHMMKLD